MRDATNHLALSRGYPARVFVIVLLVSFLVEGAIMRALNALPTTALSPAVEGILDAAILTLVLAPVVWWFAVVPMRRLFEQRGELLHRLFRAQEEERGRIARDLHDEVGQQLTALLVGLKTMESATELESAKSRARELRMLGGVALDEVRRLSRGLRPGVVEDLGLETAVSRLCEDFERTYGIAVRANVSHDACRGLDVAVETTLYRILQESLTNIARHSNAAAAEVTLESSDKSVRLVIADRGGGFCPAGATEAAASTPTMGLASIRERALMLGGSCSVRSVVGRGTTIEVVIPIDG